MAKQYYSAGCLKKKALFVGEHPKKKTPPPPFPNVQGFSPFPISKGTSRMFPELSPLSENLEFPKSSQVFSNFKKEF